MLERIGVIEGIAFQTNILALNAAVEAARAGEQSAGIEQVKRALGEMDQVTQQNASLVEQAAAVAHSLRERTGTLQVAIDGVRLPQLAAA